jgi:hypothetical protein
MTLEQARSEFAVRYYRWALQESRREVAHEFPLLRKMGNHDADRFLSLMNSMPKEQRFSLAAALVKRSHIPKGIQGTGEQLSSDDQKAVEKWRQAFLVATPKERAIAQQKEAGEWIQLKRKKLASLIERELQPILGEPEVTPWPRSSEGWSYRSEVHGWKIGTNVDLGGKFHQLGYAHHIHGPRPAEPIRSKSHWISQMPYAQMILEPGCYDGAISIFSWLGIGQTQWTDLSDDDAPVVAASVAELCQHFMMAAHALLADISVEWQ